MKHHLSVLAIVAIMSGCVADTQRSSHFFDVSNADQLPSANLSDLIEVVKVVPLENSDSVVIGSVRKTIKHGGRYYVYAENGNTAGMGTISVFDANSGRFIHTIGQRGGGPGEITPFTLIDFAVTDTSVLVTDGSNRMLSYSPEGEFNCAYALSVPADNIIALPERLLTYSQSDSLNWHIYSPTGNELMALAPANALSNIGTSNRFMEIDGGKVMETTWCNEARVYDPALNSYSDTLIADIPDVQTLARYEQTIAPTKFGTMEGTREGTLINSISTDGVSKMMITSAPDFSAFRLWVATPYATKTVAIADITDDITGNTDLKLPGILFVESNSDGYVAVIDAESFGTDKDKMDRSIATAIGDSGLTPESNPVVVEYRLR